MRVERAKKEGWEGKVQKGGQKEGAPHPPPPKRGQFGSYEGKDPGFADFSSFNDFEKLLKQLKTRIRKHKINKLCVHNEHVYKFQFLNS